MQKFMLLYRNDKDDPTPSPEEMQAMVNAWNIWEGKLKEGGHYVGGDALGYQGRTIAPSGSHTDGPYAEIKELIGGYNIINAKDLDQACELAKGCPILQANGSIEVRDVMIFE